MRAVIISTLLFALLPAGPAQAAWNVGQIFVKTQDGEAVARAVRSYLDGWAKQPDAQKSPYWNEKTGTRRLVVLPPRRGWVTLLEAVPERADPTLAEGLSRALDARVIWLEVAGSALSWRYVVLEGGKVKATFMEPKEGYGGAPLEGPMPRYRDVEALSWRFLADQGVPPAYRFLTQAHVDVSSDGSEAGKAWVIKVQRGEAGLKVGDGVFPFSLPDREASPPALIDAFIPLKDAPIVPGKPLSGQGVDLLHLTGEPTGEALDALARTLAAKERRYQAGGKVNFCHIVPERYRLAVYARLAKQRGRCRRQYQKLLKKAKEDAAVPKGTVKKPPARRPRSLPETPPPPSPRPAPPGAPAPGPAKGTGAKD